MRSLVCINIDIPTLEDNYDYDSEGSIRDFDIAIFNPEFPHYERIEFSGGGSCISIEGMRELSKALSHWGRELVDALAAGKTIFVILSSFKEDTAATGYTQPTKTTRNYQTTNINNYSVLPVKFSIRNAQGKSIIVKEPAYRGVYEAIRDIIEYHVVLDALASFRIAFTAKDGTAIGGVASVRELPGSLVLLPYFNFEAKGFIELDEEEDENVWSEKALATSHALVKQLIAIDQTVRGSAAQTPPPDWVNDYPRPKTIDKIGDAISEIEQQIAELNLRREEEFLRSANILEFSYLLYENGKPLERAVEKALRLLGYTVETLRLGDLEIDHIIVGPSGTRMIGESEGKDNSAIDISKFRQLESNINEDFERENIDQPAKGLLFGNGFRPSAPTARPAQFTRKCLINARRLGSALICTADLYAVALHLLDYPGDDAFRSACQAAIEKTVGGVVEFPMS